MRLIESKRDESSPQNSKTHKLEFKPNESARILFGPQESHIKYLARRMNLSLAVRGNSIHIQGDDPKKIDAAEQILRDLHQAVLSGIMLSEQDFERAIGNLSSKQEGAVESVFLSQFSIPAKKKTIYPKSLGQQHYLESIDKNDLVFGVGPAGTGKTFLAMAMAVRAFLNEQVERIVLTRPAIEAGEKLGFLPGDIAEKVNPYLRPLYDALNDMLDLARIQAMIQRGQIEIAPIAFMRGRTLNSSFVILDEAQNCTIDQMKMFLTRIGFGSKVVVTGDMTQVDLPREKKSGLRHALSLLKGVPGIALHYFNEGDVVRHPLVRSIIDAYEKDEKRGNG